MISMQQIICNTAYDSIKHVYNAQKHNIFHRESFESPMQTRLKGKRVHPRIDMHSE